MKRSHFSELYSIRKSTDISTELRKEGNRLFTGIHDDDSHIEVLALYNKSIAFALEDSEELAMGYGNRSALLMHIHKYEESILDIDRALSITMSEKLKDKLELRKSSCLKSIYELRSDSDLAEKTNFNAPKQLKLPEMVSSDKVPCVSKSVSLEYSKKYGRQMVANEDIKPGEIIAVEEAFVSFPPTNKLYLVCSRCLDQSWNGIPCDSCIVTIYCSEDCKNLAWQEYHEIECSFITSHLPLFRTSSFLEPPLRCSTAFRILIKMIKNHGLEKIIEEVKKPASKVFDGTFSCDQFQSCYSLASNHGNSLPMRKLLVENNVRMNIEHLLKYKNIFTQEARSKFKSEGEMVQFLKDLLTKFTDIIEYNSYPFQSYECQCEDRCIKINDLSEEIISCVVRGLTFAPCCSLFNHSCTPNINRIFGEKQKIILFSNQPIKIGEQIFLNHFHGMVSLGNPKSERQKWLIRKFNIICDCPACTQDWPVPPQTLKLTKFSKAEMKELASEHKKFCKKKKMEPVKLARIETWGWLGNGFNEKALTQVLHLIDIIYTKYSGYDAFVKSEPLKLYALHAFSNLYGLDWTKMKHFGVRFK